MCGINCLVDKQRRPLAAQLMAAANEALRHRGPDDDSVFVHEHVALGHTRLSIVDIAGGQQPFVNEKGSLAMVCNGEIYNYQELRQRLIDRGHRFRSRCDCEVIVHLYEEDPDGFVEQLQGMFAFVLLDIARQRLVMARDRVGMKPLFYCDTARYFGCSSEIKGLLATGLFSFNLNEQAVYDSFTFGYIPGEATIARDIYHVPPATLMTCDLTTGRHALRRYWEPPFPGRKEPAAPAIENEQSFAAALDHAAASHRIGEVDLSAFLSGGIDSTLVTLLLKRHLAQDQALTTFSIQFAHAQLDESPVFQQTAERYGLNAQILRIEDFQADDFQRVLTYLEQPQFSALDIPLMRLSRFVRERGIKVAYVGEGSDELLGGYFCYALDRIRRSARAAWLRPFRKMLLRRGLKRFIGDREGCDSLLQIYAQHQDSVETRFGTFPAWYPMWCVQEPVKLELFRQPLADSLGEGSAYHALCRPLHDRYRNLDDMNKSLYLEMVSRLPNYILLRSDRNTMCHSVEARLPFLDTAVIEMATRIPPSEKMSGLEEKTILRNAFRDVLPEHVARRRKFAYGAPTEWLWKRPTEQMNDALSPAALASNGLFRSETVEAYRREINEPGCSPHRKSLLVRALTGVLSTQWVANELQARSQARPARTAAPMTLPFEAPSTSGPARAIHR